MVSAFRNVQNIDRHFFYVPDQTYLLDYRCEIGIERRTLLRVSQCIAKRDAGKVGSKYVKVDVSRFSSSSPLLFKITQYE